MQGARHQLIEPASFVPPARRSTDLVSDMTINNSGIVEKRLRHHTSYIGILYLRVYVRFSIVKGLVH